MSKRNPMLRFWRKVDTSGECWEWRGVKVQNGYGRFWLDGQKLAHRVAYEWMVGPIPDGLTIDHLCRNRGCVNPDHLEPVTGVENTRRGLTARGGRNAPPQRLKNHCPNGHEYVPENVTYECGKRKCRACLRAKQQRKRERRRARTQGAAA